MYHQNQNVFLAVDGLQQPAAGERRTFSYKIT
jgi:hypothetical protein